MADPDLLSTLPPAHTEQGIMVRILLAETIGPADSRFNEAECLEAMQLMQLVVFNRMKAPKRFGQAKSAAMVDIVRAKEPVQFEGFQNYPMIASAQLKSIRDKLSHRKTWESNAAYYKQRVAKNASLMETLVPSGKKRDPFKPPPKLFLALDRQNQEFSVSMKQAQIEVGEGALYVSKALEVAGRPPIKDPSPGTLVYWRTAYSGSPNAENAKLYATKSGNSFYYIEERL